jgi:5'-nucleotidase
MKRINLVAIVFAAMLAALASLAGSASARTDAASTPVTLQILAVSDWHGQLDPQDVFGIGLVGGAGVISTYWQQDRAANPNTLTFTAGDAFGASPPLSSFFNEEPAVKAMNLMGFTADTFGNHNFDKGTSHLQQMIDLADFDYLSANLRNVHDNLSGVEPWKIYEVGGVKVGVVGITNPEAPTLVFPGRFGTIEVTDPVAAANKAKAQARAAGAKVLIALTHMGITFTDPVTGERSGPLVDFAESVGGFDLILGDHTDVQYSAVINNALVVENKSKGVTYSKVALTVDPKNGRLIDRSVTFVTPRTAGVTPDPAIQAMLAPYRTQLTALLDPVIGVATGFMPRGGNPAVERVGEVAVGNVVTDAMRWKYGTQLALTNGGGLRQSLPALNYFPADTTLRRATSGYAPGPPFDLVVGDVYSVLPFGNSAVVRTVTGAQLWAALEHGVAAMPAASGRFPQISGFKFTYDVARPAGSRVVSVQLADGTPIASDATAYTFATNDFTNAGGDGYTMLADGQGATREVLADVVLEYIRAVGTVSHVLQGRITRLN